MSGNLFYGFELDNDTVKQNVLAFAENMKHRVPRATWTTPEKLHVTVQLLRSRPEEKYVQALTQVARVPRGDIRVSILGCFVNSKGPRVLFVQLHAADWFDQVRSKLGCFGSFTPHLTLAKLEKQGDSDPELGAITREYPGSFGYSQVSSIKLYRTVGGGQPYQIVASQDLYSEHA
jgi:2'-5' RNA ligase